MSHTISIMRLNNLFRYDIAVDSIGKEDDGEQFSVAHFKIKVRI